jgi:predicted PurR-regulated permease PerM
MARPTPTQSRIFWIALTALAIVALVASVAALIWALGRVLELFGPVLWPLAIAAVLAYLLDPLVDILERRKRAATIAAATQTTVDGGRHGPLLPDRALLPR